MDEFELSDQLLACVIRIRRLLDERLKEHGLSVPRKRVLGALAQGLARQSALAAAFEVAPRTMTELIDGLERDGLVARRGDPTDRRARLVHLTSAGERVNELAAATRHEVITGMFAGFSADQRAALSRLLGQLDDRVAAMTRKSARPGASAPLEFLGGESD